MPDFADHLLEDRPEEYAKGALTLGPFEARWIRASYIVQRFVDLPSPSVARVSFSLFSEARPATVVPKASPAERCPRAEPRKCRFQQVI